MSAAFLGNWNKVMLYKLFKIIEDRKRNPVDGSYTNSLLDRGYERAAQKVGEEAVEVIIAAGKQGRQRTIEESADLIYHLFVLLVQQEISLAEVEAELQKRHTPKGS
jgi:phosphoribosyl-ATP pyrophosphohydrolase